MSLASQSARFSAVVTAVREKLIASQGLDPAHVVVVASDGYRLSPVDRRFLRVRYYGPQPDTDGGAGRRVRRVKRLVRVYLYSQSVLDAYGDDRIALLDDGAHGDFEDAVLDALDEFVPVDPDDGTALVIEPLHPLDSAAGPPERPPEDDALGLVRSSLLFEVAYVAVNRTT